MSKLSNQYRRTLLKQNTPARRIALTSNPGCGGGKPPGKTLGPSAASAVFAKSKAKGASSRDYLFVPPERRNFPLHLQRQLSARLRKIFVALRWRRLGDLHGFRLGHIQAMRGCGRTTIRELRRLLERFNGGLTTMGGLTQPVLVAGPQPPKMVVPPGVAPLSITQLPVSERVKRALRRQGIKRLGDLHELPVSAMRIPGVCGSRVVWKIQEFVLRASLGEFNPTQAG